LHPDRKIVKYEVTGVGVDHTTTSLNKCAFSNSKIALWDTWGIDNNNYNDNEIEVIVDGMLPEERDIKSEGYIEYDRRKSKLINTMHAILFFVPISAPGDVLKLLKKNFHKLLSKGYNPLVVLTRIDVEIIGFRNNAASYISTNHKALREFKEKIRNEYVINPDRVFYNINYFEEEERNINIDIFTYILLDEAVYQASKFLEAKLALNKK